MSSFGLYISREAALLPLFYLYASDQLLFLISPICFCYLYERALCPFALIGLVKVDSDARRRVLRIQFEERLRG